jgi:hypothetical protein
MKFNLRSFAEKSKSGDIHVEKSLREEHKTYDKTPDEITQKQLSKNHVPEKNVVMEVLLENKRQGGGDEIIERQLNESKSGLHKHRNTKAHSGNLNKLEEQRMGKKTQKSESASTTNPNKKWWAKLEAKTDKKVIIAQESDFSEDQRWQRLKDPSWSGADEEGILEDQDFDIDTIDIDNEVAIDENVIINSDIRPVESPIAKGLYVAFEISPNSKISKGELQNLAYERILQEGYGYLADIEEFGPESFKVHGDKIIARLIGDEYHPEGKTESTDEEVSSMFSSIDMQETDIGGIFVGNVIVNPQFKEMVIDMDDREIKQQAIDFISEQYDGISIEEDGIDLNKISTGVISFVGEEINKDNLQDDFELDPVEASNDFNIVVLSNAKKN